MKNNILVNKYIHYSTTITLAFWQFRRNIPTLSLLAFILFLVTFFVSAVSVYSNIAVTAGLHDYLSSFNQNSVTSVTGEFKRPSVGLTSTIENQLNTAIYQLGAPYIESGRLTVESAYFNILREDATKKLNIDASGNLIMLHGDKIRQSAQHLNIVRGRLPSPLEKYNANLDKDLTLEIALSVDGADSLKVDVNSILFIQVNTTNANFYSADSFLLRLKVVGIFAIPTVKDVYWQGMRFTLDPLGESGNSYGCSALVDNGQFIRIFEDYWRRFHTVYEKNQLAIPLSFTWSYPLNLSIVKNTNFNNTVERLNAVNSELKNRKNLELMEALEGLKIQLPIVQMMEYDEKMKVARVPTVGLMVILLLLIFYFMAVFAALVIERQVDEVAVLRSRGASSAQVLGAVLLQIGSVFFFIFVLVTAITLPVVRSFSLWVLPPSRHQAVVTIFRDPTSEVYTVLGYNSITVALCMLAIILAVTQVATRDIVALRKEAGRSTHKPLWLRFNLDIIAIILICVGFFISSYLTETNVLDARLRLLLFSPLVLIRTTFSILALLLIFLRIMPALLQWGSGIALRSRNTSSMIALAQLARAPRQSLRLTLLLSLATAFSLFAGIYYASQVQRVEDVTNYLVGTDFQAFTNDHTMTLDEVRQTMASYQNTPGVQGIAMSYKQSVELEGTDGFVDMIAVDAETAGNVIDWPAHNSVQSLPLLLKALAAKRAVTNDITQVPVLVDAVVWDKLHLEPGTKLTIHIGRDVYFYEAIARVEHVPTAGTKPAIMVDLQTYNLQVKAVKKSIKNLGNQKVRFHSILVKTYTHEPSTLSRVRTSLSKGALKFWQINDRYSMREEAYRVPLYLQLICILAIGPFIVLFLVLGGNLFSSWISARERLTNFVLLRALGADPHHIVAMLIWENTIIYTVAMLLGVAFGALFSWLVVPSLLLTEVADTRVTNHDFLLLQNTPPVQLVVPVFIALGLLFLVSVCMLTIGFMVRTVLKPSMNQTLRLNTD